VAKPSRYAAGLAVLVSSE